MGDDMILCYDTETSGLPLKGMPDDHPHQPKLVQLGAALYMDDGVERASIDLTILPEGWSIPDSAAKIHGITTEIATATGVPLKVALSVFSNLRRRAVVYVGHNVDFDDQIIRFACAQVGQVLPVIDGLRRECTMTIATPIMQLPPTVRMQAAGFNKYKPPNLGELYRYLFNEDFVGAHSAIVDVRGAARCYFEMKRRGISG